MNNITLKTNGTSGKVELPAGEYSVVAAPESSAITLAGHGRNYSLAAINRRNAASTKAKRVSVQFYSGGGDQWTLSVTVPNRGEWVSFIKLDKERR